MFIMRKLFTGLALVFGLLSCGSSDPSTFSMVFNTDLATVAPNASISLSWQVTGAQKAETGVFAITGCALSSQLAGQAFSTPEAVACQVGEEAFSPKEDTIYRLSALKTLPDTTESKDVSIRVADNTTSPTPEPKPSPTVNTPPFVQNDNYKVTTGASLSVPVETGVLSNDSDNDGDSISARLISSTSNGSLSLNDDGSFSYTHDGGDSKIDSFSYQATDGKDSSPTATAFISISSSATPNTAPLAKADSYSFKKGEILDVPASEGLLANDFDAEGDGLKANLISPPSHGEVILGSDGGFNYMHDGSATKTDSFRYQADDGQAVSEVVSVTLSLDETPTPAPLLRLVRQISSSSDDTEEHLAGGSLPTGSMFPTSPDLDIGTDRGGPKLVGLRFSDVSIPKDADIEEAFIQFTADITEGSNGTPSIDVYVVKSLNPATFSPAPFSLSSLLKDAVLATTWQPEAWSPGESGKAQVLDLKEVLSLITSRTNWESGNAFALILEATGDGVRIADSVDGNPDGAATLVVSYKSD